MSVSIPLTRGQVTLVDAEDFEHLNQFKWFARYNICTKTFYAVRSEVKPFVGKRQQIQMHRVILNAVMPDYIDHVNHDTLDNRKVNLRLCSRMENLRNQRPRKIEGKKSIYKGVVKYRNTWGARINVNHIRIHLGSFASEIEAANAYNKAAEYLFGDFACLNIIPKGKYRRHKEATEE
jgi:hypothetical protein